MTDIRSERIADKVKILTYYLKMTRVPSADAATLAPQNLLKELQNPTPNTPLVTINDTHYTTIIILEELFNIIRKALE